MCVQIITGNLTICIQTNHLIHALFTCFRLRCADAHRKLGRGCPILAVGCSPCQLTGGSHSEPWKARWSLRAFIYQRGLCYASLPGGILTVVVDSVCCSMLSSRSCASCKDVTRKLGTHLCGGGTALKSASSFRTLSSKWRALYKRTFAISSIKLNMLININSCGTR